MVGGMYCCCTRLRLPVVMVISVKCVVCLELSRRVYAVFNVSQAPTLFVRAFSLPFSSQEAVCPGTRSLA